jgi:hypothetical protein
MKLINFFMKKSLLVLIIIILIILIGGIFYYLSRTDEIIFTSDLELPNQPATTGYLGRPSIYYINIKSESLCNIISGKWELRAGAWQRPLEACYTK